MRYETTTIELRLSRSVSHTFWLATGHLLAGIAWLMTAIGVIACITGLGLIGLSLILQWRCAWPVLLRCDDAGGWELGWSDGRHWAGLEPVSARIVPGVIGLTFGPRCYKPLALFADAFCDGDHERLRRWLHRGEAGRS